MDEPRNKKSKLMDESMAVRSSRMEQRSYSKSLPASSAPQPSHRSSSHINKQSRRQQYYPSSSHASFAKPSPLDRSLSHGERSTLSSPSLAENKLLSINS